VASPGGPTLCTCARHKRRPARGSGSRGPTRSPHAPPRATRSAPSGWTTVSARVRRPGCGPARAPRCSNLTAHAWGLGRGGEPGSSLATTAVELRDAYNIVVEAAVFLVDRSVDRATVRLRYAHVQSMCVRLTRRAPTGAHGDHARAAAVANRHSRRVRPRRNRRASAADAALPWRHGVRRARVPWVGLYITTACARPPPSRSQKVARSVAAV
jgi:hypothetical protein